MAYCTPYLLRASITLSVFNACVFIAFSVISHTVVYLYIVLRVSILYIDANDVAEIAEGCGERFCRD